MAPAADVLTQSEIDKLLQDAQERLASKATPGKALVKVKPGEVTAAAAPRNEPAPVTKAVQPNGTGPKLSVRVPEQKAKSKDKAKDDAGDSWFNMPKTNLTPELLRDLKVLRMRNVLDAKKHFKKDTRRSLVPTYSQMGTIVDGTLDKHSSGRLTRKEKKRTIVEEVLGSTSANDKYKSRYNEVQTRKMSGKKGHYKKLMAKRRKG